LKNPQTAFTEDSMKPITAIHLVTVAALAMLSLAAARPARAEPSAVHPPELDMPDATHGKVGITHKSLLKSDVPGNPGQEVIVWDTQREIRVLTVGWSRISFHSNRATLAIGGVSARRAG
jgi:hypothetical protein